MVQGKIDYVFPAAGLSKRMLGLPKFLLPTPSGETLLSRLISQCPYDSRKVVLTSDRYVALLEDYDADCLVVPSTGLFNSISAALDYLTDRFAVILPDTWWSAVDFGVLDCDEDAALLFEPTDKSKYGMVDVEGGYIIDCIDKPITTTYSLAWGAIAASKSRYTDGVDNLNCLFRQPMKAIVSASKYIDCGTISGYKELWTWQDN